jgi:predicted alpha/beta superfamily hydrolase
MLLATLCCLLAFAQTHQDRTFPSAVFSQPRSYRLFLPANYHQNQQRYPVIYYFHGHSDRYTLEKYDDGKDTVPKIARFVAEHPVIVVAVDGYVAEHYTGFYGGSPYDAMSDGGTYDFGVYFRELITHIDTTLRTIPTRRYRATSGLSMGGYTSLFLSARYPDLIGSASAFNPSHELFAGEKGCRFLWRTRDQIPNHANTMVRLIRASGDYISQYHEELRAAYAAASPIDFEYRQDEYHRHWATSIAETFAFHLRAFANPSLDTAPEEFTYSSPYRSFETRGYTVSHDSPHPAAITLANVRQGGFTITTRRWTPDGPPASCNALQIVTAPVYRAGARYQLQDLALTTTTLRRTEITAGPDGRLPIPTDCAGHVFSIIGPGTGAQPPVLLPVTTRDFLRVRPATPIDLPLRVYNPRGVPMDNVKVDLTSAYPTAEILAKSATLPSLAPGATADLRTSFRVRFTSGAGDFARVRLHVKLTFDGYFTRTEALDVLVAPDPLPPPAEVILLDGRTHTFTSFRQKGNQGGGSPVERTVTEGKGNGNGILEPGEEATIWVRLKQGLDPFDKDLWHRAKVYADSPFLTEIADIQEEKQREWTGARNRTSLLRLSPEAARQSASMAQQHIPLLLDRESWSFTFTPDVRYGPEPLYQAYQLHQHHLFDWTLKVPAK